MNVYLEKLTAGNLLAFSEFIQCPSTVLRSWLDGANVPRFDNLLRTSRCLEVSVSSLFTPDGPTTANIAAAQNAIANRADRGVSPYRDPEKIRDALLASLRDEVPRTLSNVARSLGYKTPERLYLVDRPLCHDVAERYRRSGRSHAWKKPGASRICEVAQMKRVLEETLAMSEPTPLFQVATGLGYANIGCIQQKFPDLCTAIRKKIIEVKQQKREIMRGELENAALENPPPSLSDMAYRLGYSSSSVLRAHEPELCDRLAEQYKAHQTKHIADLERNARAALAEIPVPSVSEVMRRLGISRFFMDKYFSTTTREIAAKHRLWAAAETKHQRELLFREVHRIAAQFQSRGLIPTRKEFIDSIPAGFCRKRNAIQAAVREARWTLCAGCSVSELDSNIDSALPQSGALPPAGEFQSVA